MKNKWKSASALLDYLNTEYSKLHTAYEDFFWLSYMGDHSYNKKKDIALNARDAFRADEYLKEIVDSFYTKEDGEMKERLSYWRKFFSIYQTPVIAKSLKEKITALETKIESARSKRKEGYIDPVTKKFIKTSINKMRSLIGTESDEKVRKACFEAIQNLPIKLLPEYVRLVKLRNQFAQMIGYKDFYSYKLETGEGMIKEELFEIFDSIYNKTKYAFKDIRLLEKKRPGLRKPWNYSYMLSGSFTKEEDPYFPFEQSLIRWGTSLAALGMNFKGAQLKLDLLDRESKYNNGFCHWPELVQFKGNKRIPGRAQFTCNVSLGTPGESLSGMVTLFHEGGHALHLTNSEMRDVCINHEYPPASTAWDETQSMFSDTILSSIEWRSRYAYTADGKAYPFELYERKVKELSLMAPLGFSGIGMVCEFEKNIYETKELTVQKVINIAKKTFKKYRDLSVDSVSILEVPHIYSWESSCSYQGYGLAELALSQWREYFYKKYGYIVDNPNVGMEMRKVWELGASKTFPEFVKIATGKKLSADAFIKNVTRSIPQKLKIAKERIEILSKKPKFSKPIDLNATIIMVHGKKVIADNKKGFEAMADNYAKWLKTQYSHK